MMKRERKRHKWPKKVGWGRTRWRRGKWVRGVEAKKGKKKLDQ